MSLPSCLIQGGAISVEPIRSTLRKPNRFCGVKESPAGEGGAKLYQVNCAHGVGGIGQQRTNPEHPIRSKTKSRPPGSQTSCANEFVVAQSAALLN